MYTKYITTYAYFILCIIIIFNAFFVNNCCKYTVLSTAHELILIPIMMADLAVLRVHVLYALEYIRMEDYVHKNTFSAICNHH